VNDTISAEILAVLREALSNVARHAKATSVDVEASVTDDEVRLVVADDGKGPPPPDAPRGHGLANMTGRAARLGGTFGLEPREPSGTIAEWRVPRA
jgi:signal transduction histidine kinase